MRREATIDIGPVFADISGITPYVAGKLVESLNIRNQARKIIPLGWMVGDKLQIYNGLVPHIQGELRKYQHVGRIRKDRPAYKIAQQTINNSKDYIARQGGLHLRHEQEMAISICSNRRFGILCMGTGTGKTITFITQSRIFDRVTCVLIDTIPLAKQIRNEYLKFFPEEEVGYVWQGKECWRKYNVAVIDSIRNRRHLLQKIEYLILDEAHLAASPEYVDVIEHCPNLIAKHGFTGTNTRTYKPEKIILEAMIGPELYRVSASSLIAKGQLPQVNLALVRIRDESDVDRGIIEVGKRSAGQKVLILTKYIEHSKQLVRKLRKYSQKVWLIHSEIPQNERTTSLDAYSREAAGILVATKLFEKGINIPSVDLALNAKLERSEVATRQSIGRILRGKVAKKYVDFSLINTSANALASKARQSYYYNEPAFNIKHYTYGEWLTTL